MTPLVPHRLFHQQIAHHAFQLPNDLVAWMGAMQAQDYAGVKWAVGVRLPASSETVVEEALAEADILRTWLLRGTLHLVSAADIRWMLAVVAPHLIEKNARRYRQLELDTPTLMQSNDVLGKAVHGGQQRTRKELLAILEGHGISTEGQRGYYMLQRAALDGLIAQSVTLQHNNATFLALDDVVPSGSAYLHEEAIAELARRYFTSHGPATLQDFIWWSGLLTADARQGLEAVKANLMSATLDGEVYWQSPTMPPLGQSSTAFLLPAYDEYLLGYKDRNAVLEPHHAQQVAPGGGVFRPIVVIDGRVVGTWRQKRKKHSIAIIWRPFESLSPAQHDTIVGAAARYSDYIGLPVTLVRDAGDGA